MILSICSGPEILKVMRFVIIVIKCIRIAVPVLLLLIGCKSFMIAITLIGNIADCGYRLPYFWGGKRSDFGADGTWGPKRENSFCNNYYFDNQKDLDYCNNDMSNWGMDCSGFLIGPWLMELNRRKVRKKQIMELMFR